MKKILIAAGMLASVLFFCTVGYAQPAATVDEPVFTFDPVIEGSRVIHTFVVKNTGDSLLTILNVLPP